MKNKTIWIIITICAAVAGISIAAQQLQQQEALAAYHECWQKTGEMFLYQDRLVNWQSWEHKFDGQIHNLNDTVKYSNTMLKTLNDPYTRLLGVEQSKKELNDVGDDAPEGGTGQDISTEPIANHVLTGRFEKLGYICLPTLISREIMGECVDAINELSDCPGLVLDLRGNPGGQMIYAHIGASLFMEKGTVGYLQYGKKGKRALDVLPDCAKATNAAKKKLVVLIDETTCSAAETLAAALQENGRAELVGTRTYGKGIIQCVAKLPGNLMLHITGGRWFTPSGKCFGSGGTGGVTPDIVCTRDKTFTFATKQDNQLVKGFAVLQELVDAK